MSDIRPLPTIPDRIEHLGSDLSGILRATGDGQPPSVVEPSHDLAIDGNWLGLNYPGLGLINPARTPIYETCYRPVSQPTSMLGQPASRGGTWDHYLSYGKPGYAPRMRSMPAGYIEVQGGSYKKDSPGQERFYLNSLTIEACRRIEATIQVRPINQLHWGALLCLAYLDTHNHLVLRRTATSLSLQLTVDGETTVASTGDNAGPGQIIRSSLVHSLYVESRHLTLSAPVVIYGLVGVEPSEWAMPPEIRDLFFGAGVQTKVGVGGWTTNIRIYNFRCDLVGDWQ